MYYVVTHDLERFACILEPSSCLNRFLDAGADIAGYFLDHSERCEIVQLEHGPYGETVLRPTIMDSSATLATFNIGLPTNPHLPTATKGMSKFPSFKFTEIDAHCPCATAASTPVRFPPSFYIISASTTSGKPVLARTCFPVHVMQHPQGENVPKEDSAAIN